MTLVVRNIGCNWITWTELWPVVKRYDRAATELDEAREVADRVGEQYPQPTQV